MALADLYYTQNASLGDDPFGDVKTTGCVLATQSIRINPGDKTIVIALGIYNAEADYTSGERPIWKTGISINSTEYHPSPGGAAEWTYAAYRPAYSTMLTELSVIGGASVFQPQVEASSPDVKEWILLQPAPNDPTQTLGDFFTDGTLT